MKTILCWSAGKDSTASGILAKLNGDHIDEIITVMPDPFKRELDLLKNFEQFMGMKVTIIDGPKFEDYFFKVKGKRAKYPGTIYGWPFTAYKTCARILKWQPMKQYIKGKDHKFIIGIAKGEARNILEPNESLLIKYGLTEEDAKNLCIKYNLLNPMYEHFKRLGCVRCPKQRLETLKKLKVLEPEKYQWILDNDHKSPVSFFPRQKRSLRELLGED